MNYYRVALVVFAIANAALFTTHMLMNNHPWNAYLVFLGYVYINGPLVVSFLTAQKMDKTLKGHWLNWVNLAIPTVIGIALLLLFLSFVFKAGMNTAILTFGGIIVTALWLLLLAVMLNVYVFVSDR